MKSQNSDRPQQFLPTGIPDVDALLPNRGLPTGSVIEWIPDHTGGFAASVALSLSTGLLSLPGCLAVIDPLCEFNAQAMASVGIGMSRLMIIRPDRGQSGSSSQGDLGDTDLDLRRPARPAAFPGSLPALQADTLWALEQTARCSGVRVAICWIDRMSSTALRRLQLAVERSGVTVFLVRPASVLRQSSWADLRIGIRMMSKTIIRLQILYARHQIPGSSSVRLMIDDETGVVRSISELANTAAPL